MGLVRCDAQRRRRYRLRQHEPIIIASYNVDSVLKTATGEHTATLTAGVFADGNYCAMGMGRGNALVALGATAQTATACYVTTRVNSTAAPNDSPYNSLVIFD